MDYYGTIMETIMKLLVHMMTHYYSIILKSQYGSIRGTIHGIIIHFGLLLSHWFKFPLIWDDHSPYS